MLDVHKTLIAIKNYLGLDVDLEPDGYKLRLFTYLKKKPTVECPKYVYAKTDKVDLECFALEDIDRAIIVDKAKVIYNPYTRAIYGMLHEFGHANQYITKFNSNYIKWKVESMAEESKCNAKEIEELGYIDEPSSYEEDCIIQTCHKSMPKEQYADQFAINKLQEVLDHLDRLGLTDEDYSIRGEV